VGVRLRRLGCDARTLGDARLPPPGMDGAALPSRRRARRPARRLAHRGGVPALSSTRTRRTPAARAGPRPARPPLGRPHPRRAPRRRPRMRAGLGPARPLRAGVEEIAVVDDFYDLVRAGRIDARRGEIARCTGGTALELTDGTRLDADLVVFATGWRQDVSFLHQELPPPVGRDRRDHLYPLLLPPP